MVVIDGRTRLEHLSTRRCWELLAATPVGRIGVLNDSAPEIYPVNHAVDGRSIVFRTDPGTKLRGLIRSPAVCFEVDGVDLETAGGWSVLVKGRAVEVHDDTEQDRLAALPLRIWTVGDKPRWVRVIADDVAGRRIWNPVATERAKETHGGSTTAGGG
jgi:uncharacterized protein